VVKVLVLEVCSLKVQGLTRLGAVHGSREIKRPSIYSDPCRETFEDAMHKSSRNSRSARKLVRTLKVKKKKKKKKKKKNLDSPLKKDMQYQLECKALSVTYTFNMLEKDVSTKVDNSNQPSLL
jgi:hypothetical protein